MSNLSTIKTQSNAFGYYFSFTYFYGKAYLGFVKSGIDLVTS